METMLSIWAHPDDETFLAAGIMAAAVDRGDRVVCVSATAGERGTPDPEAWPPARLGALRRREAAAAMAVLGVDRAPDPRLPRRRAPRRRPRGGCGADGRADRARSRRTSSSRSAPTAPRSTPTTSPCTAG